MVECFEQKLISFWILLFGAHINGRFVVFEEPEVFAEAVAESGPIEYGVHFLNTALQEGTDHLLRIFG
jgi:hypothetical protein